LAGARARRLVHGGSLPRHDLQPAHFGPAYRYRDTAGAEQGGDRVPRPRLEERHARAARAARVRPQHHLGTVRPQPARGSARGARPGARDARGHRQPLGDPRARGEQHHPRRGRHAPLLRRVEPAHGARVLRPGAREPAAAGARRGLRRMEQRSQIEELVYRSCMALDERDFKAFLDLCDPGFRYKVTVYSPEIRKEMVWLDHDRKGMETLFTNLPRHNSDHSPLVRHATVYTVKVQGEEAEVVSALQV